MITTGNELPLQLQELFLPHNFYQRLCQIENLVMNGYYQHQVYCSLLP